MGGKSKKATVGYWYKLLWHAGLCKGPFDAFLEFRGGDKPAWQGELTSSGTISINAPNLWGGEKDQGGIVGDADIMFGEPDQEPNAYLLANLGDQVPAWRGLGTLVFKGGKYGAMNPYPQKASYKVRKILQGWDGTCWYPTRAAIAIGSGHTAKLFEERFLDGLDGWTLVSGSATNFDIVPDLGANACQVGPDDDVMIRQTFASPISGVAKIVARFKIMQRAIAGDYGVLDINSSTGPGIAVGRQGNAREVSLGWPGFAQTLTGSEDLQLGVWYRCEIDRLGEAGYLRVVEEETGVVYAEAEAPSTSAMPTCTSLILRTDDAGGIVRWAGIELWNGDTGAMNPAHILYYSRTNSEMGREPTANINEASLQAAADILHGEGFGLCAVRDPGGESVEDFEQRICRVIGGSFSRSLVDGQWYLDLARGDYELDDLPVLADDDILSFREMPSTLDNAINSVSVRFFDPETKQSIVTPPVQARALAMAFGTIHQTYDYPEIPNAALAARVALRELMSTATPTRAFQLVTTRVSNAWRPNQYFRLQLPKRGIADMVCIVGEKNSGVLRSGAIRMNATQDIYSLPAASFVEVEPGVDTRPSEVPVPIVEQRAFEAPYVEVVTGLSRADLEVLPPDIGYLLAVATDPAASRDYTVTVQPDGGDYAAVGDGEWCPSAIVNEAAGYLDTGFTISDGYRLDQVVLGSPVLWDDEICRVDALDAGAGTLVLGRACADSVPVKHAAGSRLWFWADVASSDATEYTEGETVNVKLLTNTGSQQLHPELAAAMPLTFAARQARPYPPAQFRINGEVEVDAVLDSVTVTGVHRDRVLQADQLVDTEEATVGPESGTTYTARYYLNDVLVHTDAGLAEPSSTYAPTGAGVMRVELEAVRDGMASFQMHVREFSIGNPLLTEAGEPLMTEDDQLILME